MSKLCYCGSEKKFSKCCQPFIQEKQFPETPEQLMRSRYSAFFCGNLDYLIATHWPIDATKKPQLQQTFNTTKWIGLKIIATHTFDENTGQVEFAAFYAEDQLQQLQQLHEVSTFIKKNQRWYYLTGEHLKPIKLSRNALCICGSQKKFKKCHGMSQ